MWCRYYEAIRVISKKLPTCHVTIRTESIILGIHFLIDHIISVPDPHLALTYITWSSKLPYISGSM